MATLSKDDGIYLVHGPSLQKPCVRACVCLSMCVQPSKKAAVIDAKRPRSDAAEPAEFRGGRSRAEVSNVQCGGNAPFRPESRAVGDARLILNCCPAGLVSHERF